MELRLPFILKVSDYHEFADFADKLNQLFARTYRKDSIVYEEMGVLGHQYVGIFMVKGVKMDESQKIAILLEDMAGKFKNDNEVAEFFSEHFDTFKQEDVTRAVAISLNNNPEFYRKSKKTKSA